MLPLALARDMIRPNIRDITGSLRGEIYFLREYRGEYIDKNKRSKKSTIELLEVGCLSVNSGVESSGEP